MAVTLKAHTGTSGANTTTSSAIDTTGATLIVVNLSGQGASLSDSKGNTWTVASSGGTNGHTVLYYKSNPTVGTGHTFTFTGTSVFTAMQVQAFSGAAAFDAQVSNGGSPSAFNLHPGSITPSVLNELFVTAYEKETGSGDVFAVDSSFTITDQTATGGASYGGAMAWKISSVAENPFWSGDSVVGRNGATMATFLSTSGLILPGTVQAAEAVANAGRSTVVVMPMNVTAGNLLVVMTGHPGPDECMAAPGVNATYTDTRGLTFTAVADAENISGLQSNSCILTAPVTSSGPETITRTKSSGNYPVAMLVMEFAIGSPSVVSTSGGTAHGGTTVNSGGVSSVLPNLLLVAAGSDCGPNTNAFDSASPTGSVTQFTSPQGGFLFKFVSAGTYSATFNKSAGGSQFSAAAALISYILPAGPTTVSVTCDIVIPPALGTPTGIWLDLWVWRQLWHLDALTDTVAFLPVYRRALVMGLARELCREYGRDPAVVQQQADQAMAELEQSNLEIRTEGVKDLDQ